MSCRRVPSRSRRRSAAAASRSVAAASHRAMPLLYPHWVGPRRSLRWTATPSVSSAFLFARGVLKNGRSENRSEL